jgi:hypothetical protein
MTATCKATLALAHHEVSATTNGHCAAFTLTMHTSPTSSWLNQVATATSNGSPIATPCGYWQADFKQGVQAGHTGQLAAWLRGDNQSQSCSDPVTTTTTTTTTVAPVTTTVTPGTTAPHTVVLLGAATTHAAHVTATTAAPTSGLAFTGSSVGPELGAAGLAMLVGAVFCRLARGRRRAARL